MPLPAPPVIVALVDICIVYLLIPLGSVASFQSKKGVVSLVKAPFAGDTSVGGVGPVLSSIVKSLSLL